MNNEDVLTAFEVWLQAKLLRPGKAAVPEILSIIREFAKATGPVPLAEATDQQIDAFERGHKVPAADTRFRTLVANVIAKVRKAQAELRYDKLEYAMLLFRNFRNSVLRKPDSGC